MPPDTRLRADQVEAFVAWVNAGAAWPETSTRIEGPAHWAFEPVRAVALPEVLDTAWVRTSVDPFIRAAQEAAGIDSAPPADHRTLIRRATYDLTGLPPTADEVTAFENDPSPAAFEAVVERLLHSPHYGEHWGRHWLDLVRYADTAGENTDHPLPHAWRYRNWVIQAVNDNMPYDQFVREQVAGDLLGDRGGPPTNTPTTSYATGYLAIARRFGHEIDKDIHLTIEDTIDTLGKSVLGLTVGCARCHDHKYDPLSVRDYYGLYGILASTRYSFPGCEPQQRPRDLVPLMPPDEYASAVKPLEEQLVALDAHIKQLTDTHAGDSLVVAQQQRTALAAQTMVPVAYAVSEGQAANARIQLRGDPADLGDEVPRKFLDVLGGQTLQSADRSGRLELAAWLTDAANPLTARVFVNRVWQWHFGRGLVTTPNDFGTRGARRRIPNCSTTWPASSSTAAGTFAPCTGGSCSAPRTARHRQRSAISRRRGQ